MISPSTLRGFPIFAEQNSYMVREIALIADEVVFETDEWLFYEDEPADYLYIILEGGVSLTLTIHLASKGEHIETMRTLKKREIIGVSSVVNPQQYRFGAIATEKTRLLRFNGQGLIELFDDNPIFGYQFLRNITEIINERLKQKCIQLLSLVV